MKTQNPKIYFQLQSLFCKTFQKQEKNKLFKSTVVTISGKTSTRVKKRIRQFLSTVAFLFTEFFLFFNFFWFKLAFSMVFDKATSCELFFYKNIFRLRYIDLFSDVKGLFGVCKHIIDIISLLLCNLKKRRKCFLFVRY